MISSLVKSVIVMPLIQTKHQNSFNCPTNSGRLDSFSHYYIVLNVVVAPPRATSRLKKLHKWMLGGRRSKGKIES